MKNNLLLPLAVLSLCLICNSCVETKAVSVKKEKSDRKNLGLKGAVKRMESAPSLGASGLKDVCVFNEAGDIVEQSSVYRRENRVYDKTVSSYDAAGRKIAAETSRDGKLQTKSSFKSDRAGNVVEQIDYDANGKLNSTTFSKYDDKGNLTETILRLVQPIEGGLLPIGFAPGDYKTVYTLDENGNPRQIQTFFPNLATPFGDARFVYNRENQKIEEIDFQQTYKDKAPRIERHFHKYNERGDLVETGDYESIKESNVEEVRDRFKVIDNKGTVRNGLLVSDKPFMILWSVTVCDYEYDASGNWTKQTCKWKTRDAEDFAPQRDEPTQRIITYF